MLHIHNEIPDPTTVEEAHEIQQRLTRELRFGDRFQNVAGAAVVYSKDGKRAYVAAVVLSITNWRPVSQQLVKLPVTRPYEMGMLEWREAPLLLEALVRLPIEPDLIFVEGHGIAHPRKFGCACHVGYALAYPTIGVSKMWPSGCRDLPATIEKKRGNKIALLHDPSGDRVGYQVYLQDNLSPLFVSPGNCVSVDNAVNLSLRCSPWYPFPEPLRAANEAAIRFHDGEKNLS